MTDEVIAPQKWAIRLTHILNAVLGANRFPVDVESLARDFSHDLYPDDPITLIKGDSIKGIDGCLAKAPTGKKGWGIIYNNSMGSDGRIKFTLAHEFGHYLLHRLQYPDGIECGEQDFVRWDSEYGQIEYQANEFAATLLMPLDDYRRQIDARSKVDLDTLGGCAARYGVSFIAATLRWIQYTERRTILVVSRDGYILWARSSQSAFKSGAFFKTVGRSPIAVPENSLAAGNVGLKDSVNGIELAEGTWLNESCQETAIISEQYDFSISLLQLENGGSNWEKPIDD